MGAYLNLIGQKFNRLTIVSGSDRPFHLECRCDCGKMHTASKSNLELGKVKSCGCLRDEKISGMTRTHGLSKTTEFKLWMGMKRRCYDTESISYERYGAMGITVCDRWKNSFTAFLNDMGLVPEKGLSLDRINNAQGYSPENCRWATRIEQGRNKRNNRIITIGGVSKPLVAWAEQAGINDRVIYKRLARGCIGDSLLLPSQRIDRTSNGI